MNDAQKAYADHREREEERRLARLPRHVSFTDDGHLFEDRRSLPFPWGSSEFLDRATIGFEVAPPEPIVPEGDPNGRHIGYVRPLGTPVISDEMRRHFEATKGMSREEMANKTMDAWYARRWTASDTIRQEQTPGADLPIDGRSLDGRGGYHWWEKRGAIHHEGSADEWAAWLRRNEGMRATEERQFTLWRDQHPDIAEDDVYEKWRDEVYDRWRASLDQSKKDE